MQMVLAEIKNYHLKRRLIKTFHLGNIYHATNIIGALM